MPADQAVDNSTSYAARSPDSLLLTHYWHYWHHWHYWHKHRRVQDTSGADHRQDTTGELTALLLDPPPHS